jgi:O-methyltransferase involved in polyketide biosynthesis
MNERPGDLSVTALYTSHTWAWGGLTCATLLDTPDSKRVFHATNIALGIAGLFRRGQTPLRHELLHRHTMIDHLLRGADTCNVLELAAGLSRRGAALSDDARYRYTEVDLPDMIAKKRSLLSRTDAGRAVLARPGLQLVGANVERESLEPWVPPGLPLFVIAEGLMIYLPADAQRRLWTKIRALADIASSVRLVFDLTPASEQPKAGTTGRALAAAMKRFTGGRGFEFDQRTRTDIRTELIAAGFAKVAILDSASVAKRWNLPYPAARTHQVLFDCSSQPH